MKQVVIRVDNTTRTFSESDWEQLVSGQADAEPAVMRYIIWMYHSEVLQLRDECEYRNSLIDELNDRLAEAQLRIDKLEQEQLLGWESKPAKGKRKKKEDGQEA